MKLTNKNTTLILLLLSLVMLSSCLQRTTGSEGHTTGSNHDTNSTIETIPPELGYVLEMPSEELQDRFVKEYVAYRNYDPEDHPTVAIEWWYGSFDDIHFVFVHDGGLTYHQAMWTDRVAGSSFFYNDGQMIEVWVNEQFLTIKEAYEQNLITVDMIKVIESIHNGSTGSSIKMR